MITPKKSRQFVFTFKAGDTRTESVSAQKRHFVSQLLSVKKAKRIIIFYNQKKNISSLEKLLAKSDVKTVLLDKNTKKDIYAKVIEDFETSSTIVLCPDVSIEKLKALQGKLKLAVHYDFPKNNASFSLRQTFTDAAETYLLVSDEDKDSIEKIVETTEANFNLGRLKGHRNASISVNFSKLDSSVSKEMQEGEEIQKTKASNKVKAKATPKKSKEKSEAQKTSPKDKNESPVSDKDEEKKQQATTSKSSPRSPSKKAATPKEEAPSKEAEEAESLPAKRSRPKKDETKENERLPVKRSRPKKVAITEETRPSEKVIPSEKTEEAERLPAKRSRPKKSAIVAEATPKEDSSPDIAFEEEDGIHLEIEVKQAPKPKVRRNPQGRIIGMGDHTPDFMLKEIIFKNSTLHEDE